MKLKALILQNFRNYRGRHTIELSDLTTFIGCNDVGKSTVLEALDIFFEGDIIKPEEADISYGSGAKEFIIECIFECDPNKELTLDSNAPTTLSKEFLLDKDGYLRIKKTFDSFPKGSSRPRPKVSFVAQYPKINFEAGEDIEVGHLLNAKNAQLKKLVTDLGISDVNKNKNPDMRQAIYAHLMAQSSNELIVTDIQIGTTATSESKNIYDSLSKFLPIYALFLADRKANDSDDQIQNPLKIAVDQAINDSEVSRLLNEAEARIRLLVEQKTTEVIAQMKDSFSSVVADKVLQPDFSLKPWKSLFTPSVLDERGISVNKRGSGFRRLLLISFLQNEAKQKQRTSSDPDCSVIYAFEEPETFMHPDWQREVIETLKALSESGDQVLLTTHNPNIASLCPIQGIRLITNKNSSVGVKYGHPIYREDINREIRETLGVLHSYNYATAQNVKVFICVEGPTDVIAYRYIAKKLFDERKIETDYSQSQYVWLPCGGNTLKDWVEREYLDSIPTPKIFIFDSDKKSHADTEATNEDYKKKVELKNSIISKNYACHMLHKRELDNYLHYSILETHIVDTIPIALTEYDFCDIDKALLKPVKNDICQSKITIKNSALEFDIRNMTCKRFVAERLFPLMTAEQILETFSYEESGILKNEILEIIKKIETVISTHEARLPGKEAA